MKEKNKLDLAESLEARYQALICECKKAEPIDRRVIIMRLIEISEMLKSAIRTAENAERLIRQESRRACPGGGLVGEVIAEIAPSDIQFKRINFGPAIREMLIMPGEELTVCLGETAYNKAFDWRHSPRHMTCGPLAGILFGMYECGPVGSKFKIERKPGRVLVISPILSSGEVN